MLSVEKTPYEEIWLYSLMGHTYGWLDLAGGEVIQSASVEILDKKGVASTAISVDQVIITNGGKEVTLLCSGGTVGTLAYIGVQAETNKGQKLEDFFEVSVVRFKT
jgi:hypothetical protein